MPSNDFMPGLKSKDMRKYVRALIDRDNRYHVERDGSDHFQLYHGDNRVVSIAETPRSEVSSLRIVSGKVKAYERENGLLVTRPKPTAPRQRKPGLAPGMSGFAMPTTSGNATMPRFLAPGEVPVASLLDPESIAALQAAVQPEPVRTQRERRVWDEAAKAAIVMRHRNAQRGEKGKILAQFGIYQSHIAAWTKQLQDTGRYPQLNGPEPVVVAEPVTVPEPVVVVEAEPDTDVQVLDLTRQWSALAKVVAKLDAERESIKAQLEALAARLPVADQEYVDASEQLAKVREQLRVLVEEEMG